ncbi:MAG: tetratricopeptide repeat protein, partial [Vulcanimicrobiaceae bacterium]
MIPAIIAQVDDGDRFYQLVQQQRYAEAVPVGERYLATHSGDDAFAVDLAYALLDVGKAKEARRILTGRDAYFRAHSQAASIWRDIGAAEWKGPRFESYSSTQYEGRFGDQLFDVDQTYALAPPGVVQPYVAMHLSEDLRSGAPGTSQIFSDNALVTDAGVRRRLGPYLVTFIEAGAGIGLRGQGTIPDLRYGLAYSRQWASAPLPSTSINLSASIYSRYAGNGIAYY